MSYHEFLALVRDDDRLAHQPVAVHTAPQDATAGPDTADIGAPGAGWRQQTRRASRVVGVPYAVQSDDPDLIDSDTDSDASSRDTSSDGEASTVAAAPPTGAGGDCAATPAGAAGAYGSNAVPAARSEPPSAGPRRPPDRARSEATCTPCGKHALHKTLFVPGQERSVWVSGFGFNVPAGATVRL